MISFGVDEGPFPFVLVPILIVLLVATWVILAGSRFVQGGVMERPERVPQLYGYSVCLLALIVAFASFTAIVDNALRAADPAQHTHSSWSGWMEPSVTSFEAFRATYGRAREMQAPPGSPPPEPVPEDELRRRYEGLRADRLAQVSARARRSLIVSSLTLVVALGLFGWHWRWVRRF